MAGLTCEQLEMEAHCGACESAVQLMDEDCRECGAELCGYDECAECYGGPDDTGECSLNAQFLRAVAKDD